MAEVLEHQRKYWRYEYQVSRQYMIPLLEEWGARVDGADVLDVGCGDGGGICAMFDRGARCAGFDIEDERIAAAHALMETRNIPLVAGSLFAVPPPFGDRKFDLVVLHDVFEHLEQKKEVLSALRAYTRPGGHILITFPPYYSAYGAHQQLLSTPAARMPFFHLLPFAVSGVLPRLRKESPVVVAEVRKLASMKMGMGKFERLVGGCGFRVKGCAAYLISPNHIRFGLRPLQAGLLGRVPLLREILCSGVVYLLEVGP